MALDKAFCDSWTPRVQGLLRIILGYLLIQHGSAKLFGVPHVEMFDGLNLVSLIGLSGILEFFGGVLLLLGLFTRPTAFVLSGLMASAYFIAHASQGKVLMPMMNGGELAVVYCFVFLFFAAAGAGDWSFDGRRKTA
ncbi:MAG: DoxX family protein [Gammaproteobacteria bacterium]|nr:DoxX family protein [Gammaproteobacteria bacterium]